MASEATKESDEREAKFGSQRLVSKRWRFLVKRTWVTLVAKALDRHSCQGRPSHRNYQDGSLEHRKAMSTWLEGEMSRDYHVYAPLESRLTILTEEEAANACEQSGKPRMVSHHRHRYKERQPRFRRAIPAQARRAFWWRTRVHAAKVSDIRRQRWIRNARSTTTFGAYLRYLRAVPTIQRLMDAYDMLVRDRASGQTEHIQKFKSERLTFRICNAPTVARM